MTKAGIILAAGAGTHMKSQLPKVLHKIAGPGEHFSGRAAVEGMCQRRSEKMRPIKQKAGPR